MIYLSLIYLLFLSIFSIIFPEDLDLVAQLVEHLPFKQRVLGSSPSQVISRLGAVAQLVEQRTENPRVAGSNPACAIFEY
jgi:hypothetical protein